METWKTLRTRNTKRPVVVDVAAEFLHGLPSVAKSPVFSFFAFSFFLSSAISISALTAFSVAHSIFDVNANTVSISSKWQYFSSFTVLSLNHCSAISKLSLWIFSSYFLQSFWNFGAQWLTHFFDISLRFIDSYFQRSIHNLSGIRFGNSLSLHQ